MAESWSARRKPHSWSQSRTVSTRIGELSRELETAESHGGKIWLPADGKSKEEQLTAAGISTSTAQRYEELTGGREEQAKRVTTNATELYFAQQRQDALPGNRLELGTSAERQSVAERDINQ
jgi:hypothetical protein